MGRAPLGAVTTISRTNARHLYWSMAQQLAHHTVGGCNMQTGDMLASGDYNGLIEGCLGAEIAIRTLRKLSLRFGADLNARDTNNHWTPLMHAVHKRSANAVISAVVAALTGVPLAGLRTLRIADGPDAIRKAVRFEIKNGADVIKATGAFVCSSLLRAKPPWPSPRSRRLKPPSNRPTEGIGA